MTPLIARNTTIPTRKSEVFSTAADNQTSVEVHVVQGERPLARDNRTLGRFHLVGLPPAPRGVPQIEVTFDIDANGIVNVSAKDRATNAEQRITVTGSSGLSKEEVERMVHEAEAHATEDHSRRELIDARNSADALVYSVERTLGEHRGKLSAPEVSRVESAVASVKQAVAGDDLAAIRKAIDALQSASHAMAETLYRANAQAGTGGGAPGGADADVVDAEVVESR